MPANTVLFFTLVSLTIGLIAGIAMHRSDYCVTGMFRDAILFGDTFMLRALFLQVLCTMILFEVLRRLGLLPLYPFPLLGAPSLANVAGGILFGIGMVLAGGCVVGTLYKMGAGSVTSCAAFLGLILGSGLYAEIHPQWAAFAKATAMGSAITLPQLLGLDPAVPLAALAVPGVALVIRWHRQQKWEQATMVSGYIQPWKTALALTVLGATSYLLLTMPLGISTTYAKLAAMAEHLFAPGHVAGLAYFQAEPLHVFYPPTGAMLRGGAGPALDAIWFIQFPLIAGITAGSCLSAILLGEFALRFRIPGRQLFTALAGGTIMGLASRMIPGCNIWHLMGGLPILALQSVLFLIGLVPGTWLGGKILLRLLNHTSSPNICKRI